MINVSQTYEDIIAAGGRYDWQILNTDGNTVTATVGSTLTSGTLKMTLYETCSIGNVMSRQLDFTYIKTAETLDPDVPLKLQFRATGDSGSSAWYDKGVYWIDRLESSPYTNYVKVTAYDSLFKGNVTYIKVGTWTPRTDFAILQSIAADIGVTIESATDTLFSNAPTNITETPSIGTNGTTKIQMLSYIAAMRGGNFIINDDNELQFIKLFAEQESGADYIDLGDAVKDFDASAGEEITGVAVYANTNMYYRYPDLGDNAWVALGGRKLEPDCFIGASAELAEDLYNEFGGKTYYPYTAPTAWLDPKWQLGDKITIKDVTSVICNQEMNLSALASSRLEAKSLDVILAGSPSLTAVEREIAQNEQNIASIQIGVDNITSTVSQMTEEGGVIYNLQTQVTQNAEGIEAVTQRIDGQESYLRWDGSTATLSIGETTSPTEAQVSPQGFAVVQNGEEILSAEGHVVTAKHLEATDTLTVGRWQWVDEDTKGFSLIYYGS